MGPSRRRPRSRPARRTASCPRRRARAAAERLVAVAAAGGRYGAVLCRHHSCVIVFIAKAFISDSTGPHGGCQKSDRSLRDGVGTGAILCPKRLSTVPSVHLVQLGAAEGEFCCPHVHMCRLAIVLYR